jgi:nitrogen fixation protein FixH
MSLLTLFGGLALVLVLFALAGRARLPAALRALLAVLPPLLAYLLYAAWRWPGLDVVAIHVAVFLSAGLALVMLSRRGKSQQSHWAPRLFVAFMLALVMLNAGFMYIATHGLPPALAARLLPGADKHPVNTAFSGVVGHGQDAAKAQSSTLSRDHRQALQGWRVEVNWPADPIAGAALSLSVRLAQADGTPLDRARVEMRIARPGAARAQVSSELTPQSGGGYAGELRFPAPGRWNVELEARHGEGSHQLTHELVVGQAS